MKRLFSILGQKQNIKFKKDILLWHEKEININNIEMILYGKTSDNKYLFWYLLKDENIYYQSSSIDVKLYDERKHKLNKKDAILLKQLFNENNLKVIPSMYLKAPIGLMGCSITGGFKKNDFITLAGNNKNIFVFQGLDANPSNRSFEIFETKSFRLEDNIFSKEISYKEEDKYESDYQAYVINISASLENCYIFIPWKDKKIIFDDILYFKDIENLSNRVKDYFLINNNLMLSKKNCRVRNNP